MSWTKLFPNISRMLTIFNGSWIEMILQVFHTFSHEPITISPCLPNIPLTQRSCDRKTPWCNPQLKRAKPQLSNLQTLNCSHGNTCWVFPKIGKNTPKWMFFLMENPSKMDDLGGKPLFSETSICWVVEPKISTSIFSTEVGPGFHGIFFLQPTLPASGLLPIPRNENMAVALCFHGWIFCAETFWKPPIQTCWSR